MPWYRHAKGWSVSCFLKSWRHTLLPCLCVWLQCGCSLKLCISIIWHDCLPTLGLGLHAVPKALVA